MSNDEYIFFDNFNSKFQILNKNNFVNNDMKDQFCNLLPELFNYEEEGEKLNFRLLFIENLDNIKKTLPNYIFQKIISSKEETLNDKKQKTEFTLFAWLKSFFERKEEKIINNIKSFNLRKNVKSIAPFSLNGWDIYISINKEIYEMGIYKDLGTIDSLDLVDILSGYNFIEIEKIDKHKLALTNDSEKFILSISTSPEDSCIDRKKNINNLVSLFSKEIRNEYKKNFSKGIANSLFHNMEKVHGTIIVIQDKNKDLNEFIKKGILFETPIDLFEEYLNYNNNCSSNDNIAERYYSKIGILSVILNIDGITLISNDGKILGYNIFIDNKNVDTSNVIGGARKRAAYSIENSNIDGLIGLYFQSHDGDNYFKELN